MDSITLLGMIALGTFVIVGVSATGFVYFSRFLNKEKEVARRFREMHGAPPDER